MSLIWGQFRATGAFMTRHLTLALFFRCGCTYQKHCGFYHR